MSRKNSDGVPLSHVIRKYMPIPEDSGKGDEKIIYQESVVGYMFTIDSRKVFDILKKLTLVTEAETWIKGLNCGRKLMQEFQDLYYSTEEGARRNQSARADLTKMFYKNETTFTFYKYVTKLKGVSMCWRNMVSHFTRSRLLRIY